MPRLTISCAGIAVMSLPLEADRALAAARFRPLIERSVVVLPAPFAPSSVTISPSRTCSEMPLSAWIDP